MQPDPLAGTPYRTVRALAFGSMGEIVEAEHLRQHHRVVVKLLHRHLISQHDLVNRMRLEAQALGCIRHPNVVEALGDGLVENQRPYLVMEQLNGHTLRDELITRGTLPAEEAIHLATQALDGLAALHTAGIVHRDLKLDNLFVCDASPGKERVLKLLDLGAAKVSTGTFESRMALQVRTQEGVALGTPRFFSPEQALGAPLDARADVYGMGVVLYAMITGHAPFDHHLSQVSDVMAAHAHELPAPPSQYARIPAALEALILRALSKQPDDRFPDAASFAAELRKVMVPKTLPRPGRLGSGRLFCLALVGSFVLSAMVRAAVHALHGTASAPAVP